jgi:hypothetical protein
MYAILRNAIGRDGTISIFARDLAAQIGCGETSIQRFNAELRDHGLIETRGQGTGKPLRYVMLGIGAIAAAASSAVALTGPTLLISGYFDSGLSASPEGSNFVGSACGDTSNSRGQQNAALPPDPYPTREYLNNTHDAREALPAELCVLFEKLKALKVSPNVARQLVDDFPKRTELQLHALKFRSGIRSQGAYIIRAIRDDIPIPQKLLAMRERDESPRPIAQPKLTREERLHLELEAHRATDAMLESLPNEIRYQLRIHADLVVSRPPFSSEKFPAETRRRIHRAKMVELAEEYHATGRVPA